MKKLEKEIKVLLDNKEKVIIAIDGPCASGKSTLAAHLAKKYDGNLFHMDDFFLTQELRSKTRLSEPGGNIDYKRFSEEILKNLKRGFPFKYRPYNCQKAEFDSEVEVFFKKLNIIEGVYSMRSEFTPYYDIKIFIKISRDEQIERIRNRNADSAKRFLDEWMPLEDKYFTYFSIENTCDYILDGITLKEI